jgi:hypothetical protein
MGFICNAAGVFTRAAYEAVGPLNEAPELKAHEDYEYWMRILMQFPGYFMDEKLVGYRVHPGSIQKTSPWGVLQRRRILHRILKQQLEIPLGDFARKSCKLWVHFFLDQFPVLKTATRVLQGKTQSQ